MNWQKLKDSDTPQEFCIIRTETGKIATYCTSHPKASLGDIVCFFVENGNWWGYLYENGRMIDDDRRDPFELAAPGEAEVVARQPFPEGSTRTPFPMHHAYPIEDVGEYLNDEIPF